jgi:hypothetical protein
MRKTKTGVLRLALISILALAATALTTTTASATTAQPLFSFCHKVQAGIALGNFGDPGCTESRTAAPFGEYLLTYADTATSLLLCAEQDFSVYAWANLYCNKLSTGGNTGKFATVLSTAAGTPTILGLPLNTATLKAKIAGNPAVIACLSGKFSIQPEENGTFSEGKLEYTNCATSGSGTTNCTVKEPIKGNFTGKLLEADKVLFIGTGETATTKEIFTEVEYRGGSGCAVAGDVFPIHGQQYCTSPTEILTLKILHELECKATESSLKLGKEEATYENKVSLDATSKEYWAILLVTA